MAKILLHGFLGRMGQATLKMVNDRTDCEIVSGVDVNLQGSVNPFPTFTDINNCEMKPDVIIDFSTSTAVPALIWHSMQYKIPVVICTTGLCEETLKGIGDLAKEVPVFRSYNMSYGVSLMSVLLKKISKPLHDHGFDIEIVEKHHKHKIDSPSGTALLLADSINKGLDNDFEYIHSRVGTLKPRGNKEIGIQSIRGGSIVGEHSIIFAGQNETMEFKHSAISREAFALGAISAALFLKDKPPGLYTMEDLIEETFI